MKHNHSRNPPNRPARPSPPKSTPLAGTTITGGTLETPSVHSSGTAQCLFDDPNTRTRIADISPVTLGAGTYILAVANHYGVGSGASENDYSPFYGPGSGVNNASANPAYGVTFAGGYYNVNGGLSWSSSLGSGWEWDDAFSASAPRYAAGNFDFTPVPEVATFGAAAVVLLGLVYVARHVRIRHKE